MNRPDDAPGRLCEEILAEGGRRAEEIRASARREGEALLARARADSEKLQKEGREAVLREAERLRERILADAPIEIARVRAARIEALLEGLREGALRELLARRGFDYRETLVALAAEALEGMEGEAFVLGLAPADMAHGEELLGRIKSPGRSLSLVEDPTLTDGGLILRDAEGRQVWDQRLSQRLARLWPQLRIPLARHLGLLEEP